MAAASASAASAPETPMWNCQSCRRPLLFGDGHLPPEAVDIFRASGFPLLDAAQTSGLLQLEDRVLTGLAETASQPALPQQQQAQDDWGQLNARRQAVHGSLPPGLSRASTLGPAALHHHQQMQFGSRRLASQGGGGLGGQQQQQRLGTPGSASSTLLSATRPFSGAASSTAEQQRIQTQVTLFELAMDKAQVDQPLCLVCSEQTAEELQHRVRQAEAELTVLQQGFRTLRNLPESKQRPLPVSAEAKNAVAEGQSDDEALRISLQSEADELAAQERRLLEEERNLDLLERRLAEGLVKADQEEQDLLQELQRLDRENLALIAEEREFMKTYQKYQLDRDELLEEQSRIKQSIRVAEQQLEELKRTNVIDDAFHIRTDGAFGTINGFRMGRLDSQPVGWTEINAALGQAVLLLDCLAVRARLRFSRYGLLAMGSWSKMYEVADPSVTFELYGGHWDLRDSIEGSNVAGAGKFGSPGRGTRAQPQQPQPASSPVSSSGAAGDSLVDTGLPPDYRNYATGGGGLPSGSAGGKLSSSGMQPKSWFAAPRFDVALVMLLQCVDELLRFFASRDEHFKPPYEIHGDKIGGFSVKLQHTTDEEWTTACRHLLTDLQYALLASMRYERRHREQQLRAQAMRAQR